MCSRAICLLVFSGLAALGAAQGGPLPLSAADYWTHIRNLEERKGYSTMARIVSDVVTNLTGANDPLKLRVEQVQHVSDLEGLAYALDDLANVYAIGVIDFKKAEHFNALAYAAFCQLTNMPPETVPLSAYFNPRRSAFYFAQLPLAETMESRAKQYYSRAGFFSEAMIASARRDDLKLLGRRIENRQNLLDSRLREKNAQELSEITRPISGSWQELLRPTEAFNEYYKGVQVADHMWSDFTSGSAIHFEDLRTVCSNALSFEQGQRDPLDIDSHNRLLLLGGIADLKTGQNAAGVSLLQRFFWAAEDRDNVEENAEAERRRIMGEAVEQIRQRWETVTLVIGIAGGIASMVPAIQLVGATSETMTVAQYNALLQKMQEAMLQSAIIGATSQSASRLTAGVGSVVDRERKKLLLQKLTLFNLQVGRYLNEFEQVELYSLLGSAYEALQDKAKAIRFYREALSLIELQRSTIASESKRINFFQIKEQLYPRVVALLLENGKTEEAFEFAERARARGFLDIVFSRQNLMLRSREDTTRLAEERLRRDEFASLLHQQNLSQEQLANAAQNLPPSQLGQGIDFLVQARTVEAKDLLPLSHSATILEYFTGEEKVHLFCLSEGVLTAVTLPVSTSDLRLMVRRVHEAVSNDRATINSVSQRSGELYQVLLGPVESRLKKPPLIIIPHGFLHYVPFAALRSTAGRFLLEEHQITYAPSASLLQLVSQRQVKAGSAALILADPDGPGQLPGALYEGQEIAGIFSQARLLTGKSASIGAFRTWSSQMNFIHIAAHAMFDPEDPMNSALLLAREGENDGLLRASEMYGLELNGAVVVLSACVTGLSGLSKGDELIGLTRPLLYAGATAVVSTLWRVGDEATAELMRAFYRNIIVEKMSVGSALRKAQLSVLASYDKPFYWAGFSLEGKSEINP